MFDFIRGGYAVLSSVSRKGPALGSWVGIALLGVIQGLTEFLPVSSSGHLVIGQKILGLLSEPDLLADLLLHVGTLMPVLWLYRRDLGQMVLSLGKIPRMSQAYREDAGLRLVVCVVVGTLPTGLMGILLKDSFEKLFSNITAVGVALLVTGGILMLTRVRRETDDVPAHLTISAWKALIIGVAQGCAITPGISRSGSTIATALLLGVEREMAARLSFVMSIPAIAGATVLSLRSATFAEGRLGLLIAGAVVSAVVGYIALRWVVRIVRRGEMHWFSFYLWPLGIAVLSYGLLR